MKIIYIAYSCSPQNGTEDKIGWYIPYEASKTNDVFVITKPDSKVEIEKFIKDFNVNINVIYCDIPTIFKKIFSGPFYSGRLNIWNRKAEKIAKSICNNNKIDIIHQINPVEFRSIGKYYLCNVPFACGPIGGGEYMPRPALRYAWHGLHIEAIRWLINEMYRYRFRRIVKHIDLLLFANKETKQFLIKQNNDNYIIVPEIGAISTNNKTKEHSDNEVILLTAGRLIYRKGFTLLLNALRDIPSYYNFRCYIIGDGPMSGELKKIINDNDTLRDKVVILGKIPHYAMAKYYQMADFFIMPSLRETTGSVILEAIENGCPVIAYNGFGAQNILNNINSITYSFDKNPKDALKDAIIEAFSSQNRFSRKKVKDTAKYFYFENKTKYYLELYKLVISKQR